MKTCRPTCPECGRILHPARAMVTYARAEQINPPQDHIPTTEDFEQKHRCEGIYCSSDCLLIAIDRGWPRNRPL